ncbi:DNA mismatch repair endonuclease MutH [Candidatus Pantoea carbekii]|uniref:DNA mismatch repair protein MutH n=1 Tax=Candidatus Pantoea carbekii TaxID=1235990 RepID=U3U791_9GAMM|nr:DNA mismatch repair endonuclease MutH [Candidatus Pantoea carbekii]AKC32396.1 DNA mismatch repair protein MutH [Candidatus Pantoea carbekii]BAO00119.1 DNA mismatch repair protein [Candidatus Pantoea carbekii]
MIYPNLLFPRPPKNEIELLKRAYELTGKSLLSLAKNFNLSIPTNLKHAKGWIGMLLELYLGANATSKPQQDFSHLGIELKSIPVNTERKPLETTFICMVPLIKNNNITWENSYLRYKLKRVLWIPVEGNHSLELAKRRIGQPLLWSPNKEENQKLHQDWEELMEIIALGKIDFLNSRYGEWLQIRPKAANSKALTPAIGENGEIIMTLPRGFYLRKNFTELLLKSYF